MTQTFHPVCPASELDDGQIKLVEVDQQLVILFRQGENYYCIDDVCTHDGGTLSDGQVNGCEISCPRHGARFDLKSGKALSMPATQATSTHAVKIVDRQITVKLTEG